MKTIPTVVILLLSAVPVSAAETTLHGMYDGSPDDLRIRFSDAVLVYFRKNTGSVDAEGVGHASFSNDPVTIKLDITDDRRYAITVSAVKHGTRDTTKWADAIRSRL